MTAALLLDTARPGLENMAWDEALLDQGAPALRFYSWNPPCVSFGYFQDPRTDIDLDYLKVEGIDLVRRPTGGRAVLHERELTYALVLPEGLLPGGVIPAYRAIAEVWRKALGELGLDCDLKGPAARPGRSAGCFASMSAYELAVVGRKILGSAQVRRKGAVLQHGSLLLSVDYARQSRILKGKSAVSSAALKKMMAGIDELLPGRIDPVEVTRLVTQRCAEAFSLDFQKITA